MLQKILVVIIGLVMSVVGALAPEGLFASNDAHGNDSILSANTAEQTLTTLRTSDGQAFTRISVLWVEVDGQRVTEDAWGTGEVDMVRFKVGVKDVENVALSVGERIVPLHPTDIITIRMFRGDFSYRGLGSPLSSVQFQGTVKTTVLKEGDLDNRVLTRVGAIDLNHPDAGSKPGDASNVAYVVLTTGEKVDTVAVEDGGARIYTEEGATADSAKDEPGNLLAKWVKINGKLVREYTWGDSTLQKVEFEPAEGASHTVVLTFNDDTYEVQSGERVVVDDFVGEYLVYQVSGGLMRLRLDGYARAYNAAAALPTPSQGGVGAPLTSFDWSPLSPKTTDTVQFHDHSTDDGIIVFRSWDFGDNTSGVLQDPTHRYAHPGTYEVTLTVTDNDLKSSNMTRNIIVRNSEPIADFDFSPKVVNTGTLVSFSDHSYDSDGQLVNWSWDFGDGTQSYTRHPTHRFVRAGNLTVTLTVNDDQGASTSLSKVILVRNAPPVAAFSYSPGAPLTLDPVQFLDNSTDVDGHVVNWNWSFGDGRFGSGSAPIHAYARPGVYIVTLTAYDDMGDADSASTNIIVGNRPPFAEFNWTPEGAPAGSTVTFTSHSSDPDGVVLLLKWSFGDGSADANGFVVTHAFPRAGNYNVTLTATDNTLGVSSVTRSVSVANTAPRAGMIFAPNPTYRGVEVVFSDTSTDPDGDLITNFTWDFGDGAVDYGRIVRHTYTTINTFPVTLTVTDSHSQSASVSRPLRVLNRPPVVTASYAPHALHAGENATFNAFGVDPDLPGGTVELRWSFSDSPTVTINSTVTRSFPARGDYSATVRGYDSEGGISPPVVFAIHVDFALPRVDFDWTPAVPVKNDLVTFDDQSFSVNGPLREWRWNFGDNSGIATLPNPTHVYTRNGTYTVRLEVTDIAGQTNFTEKALLVNLRPHVLFSYPTGAIQLHVPVPFTDESVDDDGTVDNWSWDFGDGTTSYDRFPTHPGYGAPGSFPVVLTIRDNHGATNSTTHYVNIANTAPIARWTKDNMGQPQEVGYPILFDGNSSEDPDGNPLSNFTWSWGDGTAIAHGPGITHTFNRSGRFTVGLTVWDGLRTSERTSESHKELRISPNHDMKIKIAAKLPDGSAAPISLPPYAVSVRVGSVYVDPTTFQPLGLNVDATIDRALWLHGDLLTIRINASFLSGGNEITTTLRDDLDTIFVNLTLRMAVLAQITPAPGDRVGPLALLRADTNYSGDPLYTDMLEKPHGTGRAYFADQSPAANSRVDVETRWVPLRSFADLRNQTSAPDTGILPNWCRVDSQITDAEGKFNFTFNGQSTSPCYLNGIAGGIYPAGRWEVRARPQVSTAENRVSPLRAFYVDPTGGILLGASMGLA